ncbi:MAG: hypothetical protein JWM57_1694 [Phycisphaerales bacterium]|nr:hypothetical protein [Phycisphaerales bacterium]
MRPLLCTLIAAALTFPTLGGCASYRYDVVPAMASPDSEGMTVLNDRDLVVPAAPARLRLRQAESRSVLIVENPTDTELSLDGSASAIVDPLGQSRAIAGQLIPPGAFVKFILPPLRDAPPTGPAFQFGVGVMVIDDTPRPAKYLDVGRSQEYWEWDGEGKIRVVLSIKQKNETTRHEILIKRTKT